MIKTKKLSLNYVWRSKRQLPERFGEACAIVEQTRWNRVRIQFADGVVAEQGTSAREASVRYGFGLDSLSGWRRRRARGERILDLRGRNREALERLLGGTASERFPLGTKIRLR